MYKKITIPKKFIKVIEHIRQINKDHTAIEEFMIGVLAIRLNVEVDSDEYNTLWDYIYNNSDWMVNIK